MIESGIIYEEPEHGNVKFVKLQDDDTLEGALFEVTNTATGEIHYIVTGKNGVYNSTVRSTSGTVNGNDAAVTKNADGTYTIDESKLSANNYVWFSLREDGSTSDPIDGRGSYVPGTYIFKGIAVSTT